MGDANPEISDTLYPEDMSHKDLQNSMQQQGIQAQPVTAEDQQAMAQAEANDPQ